MPLAPGLHSAGMGLVETPSPLVNPGKPRLCREQAAKWLVLVHGADPPVIGFRD